MTSSLVGSEMCIRDRLVIGYVSNGKFERFQAKPEKPAKQENRDGEPTVSYTHLTLPTICSV
eukprot:4181989-Prorocentrum_lima.AAC.1